MFPSDTITPNYYHKHKFSRRNSPQLERSSIIDRATGNVRKNRISLFSLSLSLSPSRERRMSLPPLFLRRFATIYKLRDKSHLRRRERGPRCDSPSHNYGAGRRRRRRRRWSERAVEEEERGHCVHGVRREERTKKEKDARRDKKRERRRGERGAREEERGSRRWLPVEL